MENNPEIIIKIIHVETNWMELFAFIMSHYIYNVINICSFSI